MKMVNVETFPVIQQTQLKVDSGTDTNSGAFHAKFSESTPFSSDECK